MPRLDGMAVLAAAENPPPAVIMSGTELDPVGRKDLAVRGIAYLHKPIEPEHLLDAVATALGRVGTGSAKNRSRFPATMNIGAAPGVGHVEQRGPGSSRARKDRWRRSTVDTDERGVDGGRLAAVATVMTLGGLFLTSTASARADGKSKTAMVVKERPGPVSA